MYDQFIYTKSKFFFLMVTWSQPGNDKGEEYSDLLKYQPLNNKHI